MKILKKSLALFLVVALAASAFCLEAFASSRHKEGSYSGKGWEADLKVGSFTVTVTLGVDTPVNTGSLRAAYHVRYLKGRNTITDYEPGPAGTRTARATFDKGYRVLEGGGRCYIASTLVANWYPLIAP